MKDVVRVEVETTLGDATIRRVVEVPAPPYGAETALVTGLLQVLGSTGADNLHLRETEHK